MTSLDVLFEAKPSSLIDSHCHLDFDYSPKNVQELIDEAHAEGVLALITIGTDVSEIPKIVAISEANTHVYHTVGIHPHEGSKSNPGDIEAINKAQFHPKCVAIGELGLDYYYKNADPADQIRVLEAQLELAIQVGKPIVVHSREAEEDLLPHLKSYAKKAKHRQLGVIHCFTGTQEFGQACLDLGFYISFSGILTFKNAESLRVAAKAYPIERILVETDAPFLAPIPYRGKKCEPRYVRNTALKLAEIKGISFDEVAKITVQNTRTLFGI